LLVKQLQAIFKRLTFKGSAVAIQELSAEGELAEIASTQDDLILERSQFKGKTEFKAAKQLKTKDSTFAGSTEQTSLTDQNHSGNTYTSGAVLQTSRIGDLITQNSDYENVVSVNQIASQGKIHRENYSIDSQGIIADQAATVELKNGVERTAENRTITGTRANIENVTSFSDQGYSTQVEQELLAWKHNVYTSETAFFKANQLQLSHGQIQAQAGITAQAQQSQIDQMILDGQQGSVAVHAATSSQMSQVKITGQSSSHTASDIKQDQVETIVNGEDFTQAKTIKESHTRHHANSVKTYAEQKIEKIHSEVVTVNYHSEAPEQLYLNKTVTATEKIVEKGDQITDSYSYKAAPVIEQQVTQTLSQIHVEQIGHTLVKKAGAIKEINNYETAEHIKKQADQQIKTTGGQIYAAQSYTRQAKEVEELQATTVARNYQVESQEYESYQTNTYAQNYEIRSKEVDIFHNNTQAEQLKIEATDHLRMTDSQLDTNETQLLNPTGSSDISRTQLSGNLNVHTHYLAATSFDHKAGEKSHVDANHLFALGMQSHASQVDWKVQQNAYMPGADFQNDKTSIATGNYLDLEKSHVTSHAASFQANSINGQQMVAHTTHDLIFAATQHANLSQTKQSSAEGSAHISAQQGTVNLDHSQIGTAEQLTIHTAHSTSAQEAHLAAQKITASGSYGNFANSTFAADHLQLNQKQGIFAPNSQKKITQSYTAIAKEGMINEDGSYNQIDGDVRYEAETLLHRKAQTNAENIEINTSIVDNSEGALAAEFSNKIHAKERINSDKGMLKGTLDIQTGDLNMAGGTLHTTGESQLKVDHINTDHHTKTQGNGSLNLILSKIHEMRGSVEIEGTYGIVAPGLTLYDQMIAHTINLQASRGNLINCTTMIAKVASLLAAANLINHKQVSAEIIQLEAKLKVINAEQAEILASDSAQLKAWLIENLGEIGAEQILKLSQDVAVRKLGNAWANKLLLIQSEEDIAIEEELKSYGSLAFISKNGDFKTQAPITTEQAVTVQATNAILTQPVHARGLGKFVTPHGVTLFEHTKASFGDGIDCIADTFFNDTSEIDVISTNRLSKITVNQFLQEGTVEVPNITKKKKRKLFAKLRKSVEGPNTPSSYKVTPAKFNLQGDLQLEARSQAENRWSDLYISGNLDAPLKKIENISHTHTFTERKVIGKKRKILKRSKKLYRTDHHTIVDYKANLFIGEEALLHSYQGVYNTGNLYAKHLKVHGGDFYNGFTFADSGRTDQRDLAVPKVDLSPISKNGSMPPFVTPQWEKDLNELATASIQEVTQETQAKFSQIALERQAKKRAPKKFLLTQHPPLLTVGDGDCAFHALVGTPNTQGALEDQAARARFVTRLQELLPHKEQMSPEFQETWQMSLQEMSNKPSALLQELANQNPQLYADFSQALQNHREDSEGFVKEPAASEAYLWLLTQKSYWLDQLELRLVAIVFDLSVYLVQPQQGSSSSSTIGSSWLYLSSHSNQPAIAIYYNGNDHYERIAISSQELVEFQDEATPSAEGLLFEELKAQMRPKRKGVTLQPQKADVSELVKIRRTFRDAQISDPRNRFQAEVITDDLYMRSTGDFRTNGFINVHNGLDVKVRKFMIERIFRDVYEDVKKRKSLGRAKIVNLHLKKLHESGQIRAKTTDIECTDDFENNGGEFHTKGNARIKAKNIYNSVVTEDVLVTSKPGSRDKWTGGKNYAIKQAIHPGRLTSGGTFVLSADEKIHQKGSKIVSKGNQYQYTGQANIQESVDHVYAARQKRGFSRSTYKEDFVSERSESISTDGDLYLVSDGIILNRGSTAAAGGDVTYYAKGDIEFDSRTISMKVRHRRFGFQGIGIANQKHEGNQAHTEQPAIIGKNATILSQEGGIKGKGLMAMTSEDLYIEAEKDIVFTAEEVVRYIKNKGWSLSVSFFGSEALAKLFAGEKGSHVLLSLLKESSFVSSIDNLVHSKGKAGVTVSALSSLIQGLQTTHMLQQGYAKAGLNGSWNATTDALGITTTDTVKGADGKPLNQQGTALQKGEKPQTETKVNPKVTLRVGVSKAEQRFTEMRLTDLKAGRDLGVFSRDGSVILADGTVVEASKKLAIRAKKNIELAAAKLRTSNFSRSQGFSVSFGVCDMSFISVGADGSKSKGKGQSHINAQARGEEVLLQAGQDIKLDGACIDGRKRVGVEAAGDLIMSSKIDSMVQSSTSWGFTAGFSPTAWSANYSQSKSNSQGVKEQTRIYSDNELYVKVGKKGKFTGALVHSATGKMKLDIPEIEFEDLHLESKKSSFGFNSSFMPGKSDSKDSVRSKKSSSEVSSTSTSAKTNPMGGLGVSFDKSKQSEVIRTTFGPAEEIKTNSDISGLNRDLGAAHKKGSKKESKGGIQLPTLDLEAMFQQARSVKSFFTALGTEVPAQVEGQAKASEVYRRLIAAGASPQEALYLASRPSLCQKISSGKVDAIEGLALQRIAMRAKMPAEIAVRGSAAQQQYRELLALGYTEQKALDEIKAQGQVAPETTATPPPPKIKVAPRTQGAVEPPQEKRPETAKFPPKPAPIESKPTAVGLHPDDVVSKEDFEHGQKVIDENKAYCGPAFKNISSIQDSIAVTKGNPGLVHAPAPISASQAFKAQKIKQLDTALEKLEKVRKEVQEKANTSNLWDKVKAAYVISKIDEGIEDLQTAIDTQNKNIKQEVKIASNLAAFMLGAGATAAVTKNPKLAGLGGMATAETSDKLIEKFENGKLGRNLAKDVTDLAVAFITGGIKGLIWETGVASVGKGCQVVSAARKGVGAAIEIKPLVTAAEANAALNAEKSAASVTESTINTLKQEVNVAENVLEAATTPNAANIIEIKSSYEISKQSIIIPESKLYLTEIGKKHPVPLTPQGLSIVKNWQEMRKGPLEKLHQINTEGILEKTADNIDSIRNIIKDHTTPDDLAAVFKERRGVSIFDKEGILLDHQKEYIDAIDGFSKRLKVLQKRLQYINYSLKHTTPVIIKEKQVITEVIAESKLLLEEYKNY
jgi:hypothetical protein